jgi:hypothetical protein
MVSDKTKTFVHGGIEELVHGAKEERNVPKTPTGKAVLTAAKLIHGYRSGKMDWNDVNIDDVLSGLWTGAKAGVHATEAIWNVGGRGIKALARAHDWYKGRQGVPQNFGSPGGAEGGYFNPQWMRRKLYLIFLGRTNEW